MTPAATRLRADLAEIYGDTAKAARLREQADTLDRIMEAGDIADDLLHECSMLRLKLAAKQGRQGFPIEILPTCRRCD
jgi:hypothetical protein